MRLHIIPPSNLNAEQKPLYADMRHGIAANFQGFVIQEARTSGFLDGEHHPNFEACGQSGEAKASYRVTEQRKLTAINRPVTQYEGLHARPSREASH